MFIIFVVAAIYGVASSLVFGSKPAGGMLMLQNIIGLVFNAWITAGAISCFLRIARGQASSLGELFNGGRYILPVIGANILVTLAVVFGLFLLIIPGIILALMFSQVNYLIVDRQASVFDAFGISRQCMASNKLTLFLIGLVGFFLSIPVAICTLFIGIPFLIAPFAVLMGAVVYLGVTGEWRSE